LGHVDHGKTSLLDAIRKTNIVEAEFGGITQKIGASTVSFVSEAQEKRITFIDTPGHEAFMKMRSRGVDAADIGLLVVSAPDGVMPQTKESLKLLLAAKIPFIVVLTKSDLPNKNPERVKQQLLKENVMLEGYGGDIPIIEVSAITEYNIKQLLDLILLVHALKHEGTHSPSEFKAIVIESRLDSKSGPKATIIVKSGSVSVHDEVVCNGIVARVRSLINDRNERLNKAETGEAIEALGFDKVLPVGSIVSKKEKKVEMSAASVTPFLQKQKESSSPALSLVLCADTVGSLEAIVNSLPKEVDIVLQKTGEITPSDILFAKSVGAIVIGFNIKVREENVRLAGTEKVLFKNYNIIYELIDEINDVIKGKKLKVQEEIFGKALVLASFPYEKTKVLGIKVLEGRAARGDKARLMREEKIIGESNVSSVKSGKLTVSKVEKGKEAGIILTPFLDFAIGDMLVFLQ
jgi:translation initiation factor IF-2